MKSGDAIVTTDAPGYSDDRTASEKDERKELREMRRKTEAQ